MPITSSSIKSGLEVASAEVHASASRKPQRTDPLNATPPLAFDGNGEVSEIRVAARLVLIFDDAGESRRKAAAAIKAREDALVEEAKAELAATPEAQALEAAKARLATAEAQVARIVERDAPLRAEMAAKVAAAHVAVKAAGDELRAALDGQEPAAVIAAKQKAAGAKSDLAAAEREAAVVPPDLIAAREIVEAARDGVERQDRPYRVARDAARARLKDRMHELATSRDSIMTALAPALAEAVATARLLAEGWPAAADRACLLL